MAWNDLLGSAIALAPVPGSSVVGGAVSTLLGGGGPAYEACGPVPPVQRVAEIYADPRARADIDRTIRDGYAGRQSSIDKLIGSPETIHRIASGGHEGGCEVARERHLNAIVRQWDDQLVAEANAGRSGAGDFWADLTQPAAAAPVAVASPATAGAVVPRSTAGSPLEGAGPQLATALWVGGGVVAVLLLLLFLGVRS